MKNLTVRSHYSRSLTDLRNKISANKGLLLTINPITDDVYFILENELCVIPCNCETEIVTVVDIIKEGDSKLVGLEYCTATEQLYCAYELGEVITIDVGSGSTDLKPSVNIEVIAKIDGGLQCMKLSPDHEIFTFVTNLGTVITTVSNLHVISQVDLYSSDFGSKQFVTVGWGKKETQFHGSVGKAAAKVKCESIEKNESDDGLPRITWRADGSMFAVSFLHSDQKARQFKVFNREGVLQYTSEPLNKLEEPLSWKPSGSLIATSQKLVNKHVIALFEKNGLKHREFILPFGADEVTVKDLLWSPDSEILTVCCEETKNNGIILQLWVENNYHWYLKQSLVFSKEKPLIYVTWSSNAESGKKLILLVKDSVLVYDFNSTVCHSTGKGKEDNAVVGVIDGNKALLTGFRNGVVPPPMAHQALEVNEPINAIIFAPSVYSNESWINSNSFFCVTQSNKFLFFNKKQEATHLEYECIKSLDILSEIPSTTLTSKTPYFMHHFVWLKEDTILCSQLIENQHLLCILNLKDMDTDKGLLVVKDTIPVDGVIESIIPSFDTETVYVVIDGFVFKYHNDTELDPMDIQLQEQSSQIELIQINKRDIVVSLSYRHRLSFNGKEIANNITSFYVHTKFLLLTTLQHTLICMPLDQGGIEQLVRQDLSIQPWQNGTTEQIFRGLSVRRIERSSFLILALPGESKTLLQMPRGNLECIHPRALSLDIISGYLNDLNYLTAFDLMRKQRINLNLIYDHNPDLFTENAEKFVDEISNPSWLSLFLSELQEEDVTNTIYASSYTNRPLSTVIKNDNVLGKVEHICQILRNVMEKKQDADRFIQPILISLVKNKEVPGLEKALLKIKQVKAAAAENSVNCVSPDEALKYLLYLVDVNVLFDIALGMYDSDLALLVASKSQKDPKEYIPYLKELKELHEKCGNEHYIKYSIDMRLKRYESALRNIVKDEDKFQECKELIQRHKLYVKALELFDKKSSKYKEIAKMYADQLLIEKKYHEAGIMFQKSEFFEHALRAYKLAGNWQDAIIVSVQLKLSDSELRVLYRELVSRLKEDKRYVEASNILINYLKDIEEAVTVLCEGKQWKNAVRLAYSEHRLDTIETHIEPGVLDHAEYIASQLRENKEEFLQRKSRLAAVRSEITARNLQYANGLDQDDGLVSHNGAADFMSDTTSIAGSTISHKSRSSISSNKSYRSSKNTRKQERKLLSMKEGSAFEDLGLIYTLHKIITKTYKQREELSLLLDMLVYFNFDERARQLQEAMNDFLSLIQRSNSEIWNRTAPSSFSEMEQSTLGLNRPVYQESAVQQKLSTLGLEPHVLYPPEMESIKWQLNIF